MPRITVPTKSLEPPAQLPDGLHTFRLDGFKPKWTKPDAKNPSKDRSINLNPVLRSINEPDPEANNKPIFTNLNQKAGWILQDFVHSLGFEMVGNGDASDIPGEFLGAEASPGDDATLAQWQYIGPLVGQTGQVELITKDDGKGGKRSEIKRFICRVPNCQVKHSDNLAKAA